jgi:hypothetical protein
MTTDVTLRDTCSFIAGFGYRGVGTLFYRGL